MVRKIPRTRSSQKRLQKIVKRNQKNIAKMAPIMTSLVKQTSENTAKRSNTINFKMDDQLKNEYTRFCEGCFEKKDTHFVKMLLPKIIFLYQTIKKKLNLIKCVQKHKFETIWRYIVKYLNLKKDLQKDSMAQFLKLFKKYLLPFQVYRTEKKFRNFSTFNYQKRIQLHPFNITQNSLSNQFSNESIVLFKLIPEYYINSLSFPLLNQTIFKDSNIIDLKTIPTIDNIFQQKFCFLFSSDHQSNILQISSQNKSIVFDGNNSALFFNISNQEIEWFVIEDQNLDKVVYDTKMTKTTILQNGRSIIDNYFELISNGCNIQSFVQKPQTHMLLNSGCFAWARSVVPTPLVKITFEIKSYRQLNSIIFRKSLNQSSKKIPTTALKLKTFLSQYSSQYSSYLIQAYKHLQLISNKQRISLMTLNINNIIEEKIQTLEDENAFCEKCTSDILNYYAKESKSIICLKCMENKIQSMLTVFSRFNPSDLLGAFEYYKKTSLVYEKKEQQKSKVNLESFFTNDIASKKSKHIQNIEEKVEKNQQVLSKQCKSLSVGLAKKPPIQPKSNIILLSQSDSQDNFSLSRDNHGRFKKQTPEKKETPCRQTRSTAQLKQNVVAINIPKKTRAECDF